jgi:iron-sulfur cluster repair protein YtfE (RIC family)
MAQNIIDILEQEHEVVLSQLAELSSMGISDREQKYDLLKQNLTSHFTGEEQIIYPVLEEAGMQDVVLEAIEEHNAVRTLLDRLDSVSWSEEDVWVAKLRVILRNIEDHISGEEDEIFPQMEAEMSSRELSSLGSQYEEAKRRTMPVAAQ